jgi:hypothetical protein
MQRRCFDAGHRPAEFSDCPSNLARKVSRFCLFDAKRYRL